MIKIQPWSEALSKLSMFAKKDIFKCLSSCNEMLSSGYSLSKIGLIHWWNAANNWFDLRRLVSNHKQVEFKIVRSIYQIPNVNTLKHRIYVSPWSKGNKKKKTVTSKHSRSSSKCGSWCNMRSERTRTRSSSKYSFLHFLFVSP